MTFGLDSDLWIMTSEVNTNKLEYIPKLIIIFNLIGGRNTYTSEEYAWCVCEGVSTDS